MTADGTAPSFPRESSHMKIMAAGLMAAKDLL
jgi:hypothetical protein